jgi:PAS domain S-box-containing protein
MPAKPATQTPARSARTAQSAQAAPSTAAAGGAYEAHEMLDALNAAFHPEESMRARDGISLPDALWDSAPPLAIRDRSGEISFANPAFKGLYDSLKAANALAPTEDLATVIQGLGHSYTEHLVLHIEGKPRLFLAWHQLAAGEPPESGAVISQFLPVDGLGRRLHALQDSDERWQDLTRLVTEIVWECSPQAVITYISPRVLHLLGYHPHDIIGRPWSFLAGEADSLTERITNPAGRSPFRGLELRLVDKHGCGRQFMMQGLPVFDRDSGALMGYRGAAQDMTDYIENQAVLLQAAEAAEAASRAKSEFLANMSHELRTPLNAIIGFTEIMASEEFGPIGNRRYVEYLNSVLESSQHLLGLINQVLDVAKIESGRLQLIEDSVDPGSLVRTTVRVLSATVKRRGIDVVSDVAESSVHLWADEGKLRQILLNLLSNSLKFTLEDGRVEIVAKPDLDGSFLFQVRDNGIGIDPEKFEAVLTPFEQIDSHLTRRFEGTGLGLPLAKALTEAHGGRLTLESTPGEGTTVTIRLPADRVVRG